MNGRGCHPPTALIRRTMLPLAASFRRTVMDFIDILFGVLWAPALLVGTAIGFSGALLLHWLAPAPEPLLAEAALTALGFIGGLACEWWLHLGRRK
jgi:hypothetical protein